MQRFEVVFETVITKSVFIDAYDQDEAADIAVDSKYPGEMSLPYGYELDHENWSVKDVLTLGDD